MRETLVSRPTSVTEVGINTRGKIIINLLYEGDGNEDHYSVLLKKQKNPVNRNKIKHVIPRFIEIGVAIFGAVIFWHLAS